MKKKLLLTIMSVMLCLTALGAVSVSAAVSGYYTYTVSDNKAAITDVSTSISGDIEIPSELGGYPVISIGYSAFEDCIS